MKPAEAIALVYRLGTVLVLVLLLAGCGTAPVRENRAEIRAAGPAAAADEFPESRYLTAKGIGQSEPEARRQAMAALAAVFEADIEGEVTSRAESVVQDASETFQKRVMEAVRVRSAVTLPGVRIGRTWQEGAHHCALAVLDKSKAAADWLQQIEMADNRIAGEIAVCSDAQASPFLRFTAVRTILSLWIDRQLLENRLRIIDVPCGGENTEAIAAMVRKLPELRSGMRVCIAVAGPGGNTVRDKIAERLTAEGFVLTGNPERSDVLIQGKSRIEPLDLHRENWAFVRASVSLAAIDRATGSRVAEISENTRAAHLTLPEAETKAVAVVSGRAADQIIRSFTVSGD